MARFLLLLLLSSASVCAFPQVQMEDDAYVPFGEDGYMNEINAGNNRVIWGRDTTRSQHKIVPIGVHQWTVEERLGTILPEENTDTAVHAFQFWNSTEGMNGEYSILGNLGSPRLSRIFMHRTDAPQLLFLQPYSFFVGGLRDFRFSNTLSPLTNLAYHKVGNRTNGQERVRAYFASNINKLSGIGFKLDYLYGRGYYNSQANSQFGGTVFGYYLGDRYNMHAWINANHSKTAENGGIEDDLYITNPQSFPNRYTSKDIPTILTDTWNRNDNQTYYLTHRYNLGSYHELEIPDSLKPKMPEDAELLSQFTDSVRQLLDADTLRRALVVDSLRTEWENTLVKPKEFIPVGAFIHTFQIDNLHHTYYSYDTPETYYTNQYYGSLGNLNYVHDQTNAMQIRNTLGVAVLEGFNKWAAMGVTLFATHQFRSFALPELGDTVRMHTYKEQDISVGGEISRTQGTLIHYNVNGEVVLVGEDVGQFDVGGNIDLSLPLGKRDTVGIEARGYVKRLNPGFYFRHYHSQFAWWDNDLSKEFKTRIEGSVAVRRTRTKLTVGVENVTNYTYFGMQNTLTGDDPTSILPTDYSHSVAVRQKSGNVQVFMAALNQDVKLGPLHLDMEATYQTSSDDDVLPLPKLNLYGNLYLAFRMVKVLYVELGADIRYFTSYYAPDYAVSIGQFAVQDASNPRVKIGNYPICNAYVNAHLKHCRLYFAVQHFNAGSGRMFWAPHYAMDPMTLHFGVSWNFFD